MPKLFGIDIAGIVNTAFKGKLVPATLTKQTSGTRTAGALSAGQNVQSNDNACEGIISDYNDNEYRGTLIQEGDRKVMLLGNSLPSSVVPATADIITIEGNLYNVINVKRDPAAATYTCQVRK